MASTTSTTVPRRMNWVFTLNNPTSVELDMLHQYADQDFKYIIVGHEEGENGTPHWQGYFELEKAMTISAMKKKFRY